MKTLLVQSRSEFAKGEILACAKVANEDLSRIGCQRLSNPLLIYQTPTNLVELESPSDLVNLLQQLDMTLPEAVGTNRSEFCQTISTAFINWDAVVVIERLLSVYRNDRGLHAVGLDESQIVAPLQDDTHYSFLVYHQPTLFSGGTVSRAQLNLATLAINVETLGHVEKNKLYARTVYARRVDPD